MTIIGRRAAFAMLLCVLTVPAAVPARNASDQDTIAYHDSLYGDLSEKEHCVRNYALSIEQRSIEQYAKLFRADCEFVTVLGELNLDFTIDLSSQPAVRRRGLDEELGMTETIFAAAREIRFVFESGTWNRADSLGGEPCPDCWETCRKYEYSIVFNPGSEGEEPRSLTGKGRMWFYISPVSGKWKIFKLVEDEDDNEANH